MGGAGFPTGQKWELVARAGARTPKYAICNADESEPGTFKDRQILAEQPHLVLEGLLLGMLVIGAEEGWVFIRHEYGPEEDVLRAELERCASRAARRRRARQRPALSVDDLHLARRLHPRRGDGAARVHGGPPRRAAQQAAVPRLLRPVGQADADELGRDLRRRAGDRSSAAPSGGRSRASTAATGLKFFAVSGHVERPDVYCVPMGTTVARADRAGRRRAATARELRRDPAGRGVVELPGPGRPRRAARLRRRWRRPARCSARARSW